MIKLFSLLLIFTKKSRELNDDKYKGYAYIAEH